MGTHEDRIQILSDRLAEVQAQRTELAGQRAEAIREGKDAGDMWVKINGLDQEIDALSRELSEAQNLASDRHALARLETSREPFDRGNKELVSKRAGIARARDHAVDQVLKAAENYRQAVADLDQLERDQSTRAAELTMMAQALGQPLSFEVPPEGPVSREGVDATGYRRPSPADFARARLMSAARSGSTELLVKTLGESAAAV
jgi:chromosome segregation ATPase